MMFPLLFAILAESLSAMPRGAPRQRSVIELNEVAAAVRDDHGVAD